MLQELFETHNVSYNLYLINKLLSIRMEEKFPIVGFLKKNQGNYHTTSQHWRIDRQK
jgi:hypothetical protein